MECRVRYVDGYRGGENYLDVYVGEEKIEEVWVYELDFGGWGRKEY